MKVLLVVVATLFGAAVGVAAMVQFVFVCTVAAGPSDIGLWLALPGVLGGAVAGGWAGIAIASKRPPSSGVAP